jgi:hypothetical protein
VYDSREFRESLNALAASSSRKQAESVFNFGKHCSFEIHNRYASFFTELSFAQLVFSLPAKREYERCRPLMS